MQLLKINEIKYVSGGSLCDQLKAEFFYKTPYTEKPAIYCYFSITGPADEILSKVISGDYPSHFKELPSCELWQIEITTHKAKI